MLSPVAPTDSELAGVDSLRRARYKAAWNMRHSHYQAAITLLEPLTHCEDVLARQNASRDLIEACMATGQIERAASVYVEAVLANPNLTSTFDTSGLAEACAREIKGSASIYIPIALSLYSRFVDDKFDPALKYSFEKFLNNNGLLNPIDVRRLEQFTAKSRIYFLRYVCTPEVMKLYLHFESPQEIEECRLGICRTLIAHGEDVEPLEFEVKDRTRRLVLRDATSQVQGSKIFSDANFIIGPSADAFRTLFDRFTLLRLQDFSSSADEVALSALLKVLTSDARLLPGAHSVHIPDLPLNEKNSVFLRLLKLVRDEFAFGERGLNVYLSTRIRHGYFPNTIRKPIRDNGLLATKIVDTAAYRTSRDPRTAFGLEDQVVRLVEQSLVDFSTKFNDLVDEVNDVWLRIFTVDPDISGLSAEGMITGSMFNYSISAVESLHLQRELTVGADFSEFVTLVTRWLWVRTEACLEHIRSKIAAEMRPRALALLEGLSKSLSTKVGVERLGSLPDAMARARNGLVQVFDTIPSWFYRARSGSVATFDFDIAVQIAKIAADVEVDFHDSSATLFRGTALTAVVDILYVLFENCDSKSKLSKADLVIRGGATSADGVLTVWVANSCAHVGDLHMANQRLDPYRNALAASELPLSRAQREGQSGFVKIRRILEKDLSVTHSITLGYVSEVEFDVRITIDLGAAASLVES